MLFFSPRKHKTVENYITAHIYWDPKGTVIVKLTTWWRKLAKIACEYMLP